MSILPTNPSESFKRRNPHLYGVCPVETSKPERGGGFALDNPNPKREKRKGKVEIVVTIVTLCARFSDDDNNIASNKPMRDAIAKSIGLDDGDSRIRWEYAQCETRGQHGVIVKIEKL